MEKELKLKDLADFLANVMSSVRPSMPSKTYHRILFEVLEPAMDEFQYEYTHWEIDGEVVDIVIDKIPDSYNLGDDFADKIPADVALSYVKAERLFWLLREMQDKMEESYVAKDIDACATLIERINTLKDRLDVASTLLELALGCKIAEIAKETATLKMIVTEMYDKILGDSVTSEAVAQAPPDDEVETNDPEAVPEDESSDLEMVTEDEASDPEAVPEDESSDPEAVPEDESSDPEAVPEDIPDDESEMIIEDESGESEEDLAKYAEELVVKFEASATEDVSEATVAEEKPEEAVAESAVPEDTEELVAEEAAVAPPESEAVKDYADERLTETKEEKKASEEMKEVFDKVNFESNIPDGTSIVINSNQ